MARNPLTPFRSGGGLFGGADPFLSLHREMNRLFDDVFRGLPADQGSERGSFVQAQMNVSETENELRITAELPGVTEQDIDVSLDDDVLTIRGEKRFEERSEKENFHFVERSYGTFQRALRLPFPVDPEQVQARFDNGVLTVTLPKTARQERARRIAIQGGGGRGEGSGEGAARKQRGAASQGSGPSGGQGDGGSEARRAQGSAGS